MKKQLIGWKNSLKGIINDQYINVIDQLSKLKLKQIESQYGTWYSLLTLEEQDALIEKYINFNLIN